MRRTWQVLAALYAVRVGSKQDRGPRLYRELTALGGAWLKFGQQLSFRYDLLPADICDALKPLQGNVPAIPGIAARVIEESGFSQFFKHISDEPVAAAAVGQVHRGKLVDGRKVAIKVIRPGVAQEYALDFTILTRLARIFNRVLPRLCLKDMVAEFLAVMTEELDLRFEASHMKTMRPILKKHKLRVPKLYPALSNAKVLVTEWIPGKTMTEILAMPDREEWLEKQGLTGQEIGRRLLRSLKRQVFESNRYHGDMHPGNLMVSNGEVVVIDFGSTSSTELGFLDTFTSYVKALAVRDYAHAADLYCLLCIWPPQSAMKWLMTAWWPKGTNHAAVRRAIVRVMDAWATRAGVASMPFEVKSINALSIAMMMQVMGARGAMQWQWLRITRAFSTMEATLSVLWPEADYMKELRRYLKGAANREKLNPFGMVQIMNFASKLSGRVDEGGRIRTGLLRLEGKLEEL